MFEAVGLPALTVLRQAKSSSIHAPAIDYAALSPVLIVLGAACVGVLVEAFGPRRGRRVVQLVFSVAALVAAGICVIWRSGHSVTTASSAVAVDSAGLFLQGSIVALGLLSVLLLAERRLERGGAFMAQPIERENSKTTHTEVFPLALFALGGMMLFVTANDLLVMFVALEVLSLPLYLLCGLARRRRLLSQEAAVKYFLLGAFASAFFLYGVALLYGYAGSLRLGVIARAISDGPDPALGGNDNKTLLLMGISLLVVGLLFKAGAVPFHSWTPDVYQGAPTSVTALMATCTKVAAFGAIARVLYVCLHGASGDWRPVLVGIAIVTMAVGAFLAVTQTDIKRLLAYSAIANAGFILTGTIAMDKSGLSSMLFYLAAYGFTALGAFGIVMMVRDPSGEANHISRWAGLGRRSPVAAGVMTFFLLAFAGIPLTSGFTSKFAVFSAALGSGSGSVALVVVGVIASMVIAFPYIRLVVLMYASEPAVDGASVELPSMVTRVAVGVGALATLVLGVAPAPLLHLANNAAHFVS